MRDGAADRGQRGEAAGAAKSIGNDQKKSGPVQGAASNSAWLYRDTVLLVPRGQRAGRKVLGV
jgi:hypothetical protein